MIKAHFTTEQGVITGFTLAGHADSGAYGHDLVCAAVSALAITTVNGLETVAQLQPVVDQDATNGGYLQVQVGAAATDQRGQALLQSFKNGMTEIAMQYRDFVTIK
ncbi:ribosomal-processing cysteine protease Prp [Fructilactobacillus ixorae]|uniref:Ribosomal processing cysteine protease Prp n=1 Tax=Fructilactobacillus ixorae TaxID=1750535 RepID=A0ABY5C528_9LACO|nr:ribosomal-processing cysteine protease Prp [Fructilactobacillus ixorae]USS93862.1 ribosomal-processing cysteine protease Prp [Fructilactobacillus ixorae]